MPDEGTTGGVTGVVTTGGVTTVAGEVDPEPPQPLKPTAEAASSTANLHRRTAVVFESYFFIYVSPFESARTGRDDAENSVIVVLARELVLSDARYASVSVEVVEGCKRIGHRLALTVQ